MTLLPRFIDERAKFLMGNFKKCITIEYLVESKEKKGVSFKFGISLMMIVSMVIMLIVSANVIGMISFDAEIFGVHFSISNTTILEIVALVIILIFITIWLYMRYKNKKIDRK